jgi:hypothetical protein
MGVSSIVSSMQNIIVAREFCNDFIRSHPESAGAKVFKLYAKKLQWILDDFYTFPYFPQEIRDGIKNEIKSDPFTIPAINEKLALVTPEHREMLEQIIDAILQGEKFTIEINKDQIVEANKMI